MLQKVLNQAELWKPKFTWVQGLAKCADIINQPHEDYPNRVGRTIEAIKYYTDIEKKDFSEFDLKQINSHIMWDMGSRGKYRLIDVSVGKHIPPSPLQIPELMNQILPIKVDFSKTKKPQDDFRLITNEEDLIKWYSIFETIHPYEDGNGRVGGVVVAAASYDKKGNFLVPTC